MTAGPRVRVGAAGSIWLLLFFSGGCVNGSSTTALSWSPTVCWLLVGSQHHTSAALVATPIQAMPLLPSPTLTPLSGALSRVLATVRRKLPHGVAYLTSQGACGTPGSLTLDTRIVTKVRQRRGLHSLHFSVLHSAHFDYIHLSLIHIDLIVHYFFLFYISKRGDGASGGGVAPSGRQRRSTVVGWLKRRTKMLHRHTRKRRRSPRRHDAIRLGNLCE